MSVVDRVVGIMTDDTSKFLWCIVGPVILLLYILCMLLRTDKHDVWILIFQIIPTAD